MAMQIDLTRKSPTQEPPAREPAAGPATLAFHDIASATRWLDALPLTNLMQSSAMLAGQLAAMSRFVMPARERARLAELLRQHIVHLHTELARRYAGKPQPLGERELEAVERSLALWQGLWAQYSACLKPLLAGDPELAGVKAKVLQRGLYVGKEILLVHGLARRVPPPSVWQELHAYYRLAEMLECTGVAVSEEQLPLAPAVSCYSTYSHALLLALADPCSLTVKQIELADRWLQMWARKVSPSAEARSGRSPLLVVDVDSGEGPALVAAAAQEPPPSLRFGDVTKLATSVRARLKRLQAGADPSELQLGTDCSVEQCMQLLGHLDAHWYQLPRATPATGRDTPVELCAGGLPGAYFRAAGRTFAKRDPNAHLTYEGSTQLFGLAAVSDYDRDREGAERNFAWESWSGACEYRDATLRRSGGAHHRWFLDQLVTLRDEGARTRVGYVTRVAQDDAGYMHIALRMLSGNPAAVSVRVSSTIAAEEPPAPALLLGETPDDKPCLVVTPRTFTPGRRVRILEAGPERVVRLTRLLQRGADFERVAFDHAV